MKIILSALLMTCAAAHAGTTVTATPGPWVLFKATSKVATFQTAAECVEGARVRASLLMPGNYTYSCKTSIRLVATVVADPPPPPVEPVAIVTQPASAAVFEGSPVLLAVGATGAPPLSYQWLKDATPISSGGGLTPAGPTYSIAAATPADAGAYTVVVRNSVGSVTSAAAVVAVAAKPPPPPPPSSGSATLTWDAPTWKADGTTPAEVAGYLIRYGRLPGGYTVSMPATAPPATVSGLAAGAWYFTVCALDSAGNESQAGYEVNKTIP